MAKNKASLIAKKRIKELYEHALNELAENPEDSRTAVKHLRRMAEKHNLVITEIKRKICLGCNTPLMPGKTSIVRVHDNRRVITCLNCGKVKRLGLDK